MPTKDQIINNLREYSASDIAHAIKCGEVSMYELSKSGKLTPLMKKRIEEQMSHESVEAESSTLAMEYTENSIKDILPSTLDNVEKQSVAVELVQAEITPISVVTPVIPSRNTDTESEILDNKGMFKRIFSFKGRIRRTEYGISYIVFYIWYFIFSIIAMNDVNPVLALFTILTIVPAYWFFLAQGAKRCHDRGNSGWYQIIPFYFFVMLFGRSEEGINDYGTNPKE